MYIVGRHESNLALIEHSRGTLPGAKEAEQTQRDYVGGKVDRIVERKKEVGYEEIFDFSMALDNSTVCSPNVTSMYYGARSGRLTPITCLFSKVDPSFLCILTVAMLLCCFVYPASQNNL